MKGRRDDRTMTKTMAVAVLMALCGCGGVSDEPPSCQQAVTHYYSVGCTFIGTTGAPTPQQDAINACQQININVPDNCRSLFDDWKFCVESAGPPGCDCTSESDALFACK